jgi:hypothetical protein
MWCCVYCYVTCCLHLQIRRNEWQWGQHVPPKLWCLSIKIWVCDITFQKTAIFIIICIQWISGSLSVKIKVNWRSQANHSVPFIFHVWAYIMYFIRTAEREWCLKYHKRKNWNFWQFLLKYCHRNIFTDIYNSRFIK